MEGVSRSPIESVMNMFPQSSTTMSHRKPMWWMAYDNDLECITRLLDEGVDPAADEERAVCLMMGHCTGWTGGRVSLWCVVDGVQQNGVQQNGSTALHLAAMEGYLALVQLLVERAPQLFELTTTVSGKLLLRAGVM